MSFAATEPGSSWRRKFAILLLLILGVKIQVFPADTSTAAPDKRVEAVNVTNVDASFRQSAASCTMSSYAIVANYFTGEPITAFFESYCHRFGIFYVTPLQAEERYARHFDGEFQRRKCLGIEVILDLHSNSTEKCFTEARNKFDARLYVNTYDHLEEIEKILKTREAFLSVGYHVVNDVHTVTVFYDGTRLQVRDTNLRGLYSVNSVKDIGRLVDGVLYVRRQTSGASHGEVLSQ